MPNWASNTVLIHGSTEVLDEFAEYVSDKEYVPSGDTGIIDPLIFTFQKIAPLDLDNYSRFDAEEKWGTKWDACYPSISEYPDTLVYNFSTAWVPPEPIITAIQSKYKNAPISIIWTVGGEAYEFFDMEPDVWNVVDNLGVGEQTDGMAEDVKRAGIQVQLHKSVNDIAVALAESTALDDPEANAEREKRWEKLRQERKSS